jgi:hypothetical protein
MITTISKEEAITELRNDDNASWSYEAAAAIYDYLEELEDDCGIVTVFNIVDIRCEFSEFDNLEAWNESSGYPAPGRKRWTLEDLQEHTTVLEFKYLFPNENKPNGLVVADF